MEEARCGAKETVRCDREQVGRWGDEEEGVQGRSVQEWCGRGCEGSNGEVAGIPRKGRVV